MNITAVFLLRMDSVNNDKEGEVYYVKPNEIIHCNFWNSPKLVDHQVIIANGKNKINAIFKQYQDYNILEGIYHIQRT